MTAFHYKGNNKALKTIELVEQNPTISQAKLADILYGDPKSKAFIMLKSRLLEKILEVLSLCAGFRYKNTDNPSFSDYLYIQKQLTYVSLLHHRGLNQLAKEILQKCVRKSQEAGFHELSLWGLVYLRKISNSKDEVLWHYARAIEQIRNQLDSDLMGMRLFDEYNVLFSIPAYFEQKEEDWLTDKINQLEIQLDTVYSIRAHYYYLSLLVSYHVCMGNYLEGKEAIHALNMLVFQEKGLRSKRKQGITLLKLARLEMKQQNFHLAIVETEKAMRLLGSSPTEYYAAAILRLLACIYTDQLKQAKKMVMNISKDESLKNQKLCLEIIHYLDSCISYYSGSIREALIATKEIHELFADKSGWNTGLRIHEILLLIDLEEYDLASSRIASLRKHLARYGGSERIQIIFKYLYSLERFSFDFEACRQYLAHLHVQMRHMYTWNAVSYEVIRFDTWLQAREKEHSPYSCLITELDLIKIA